MILDRARIRLGEFTFEVTVSGDSYCSRVIDLDGKFYNAAGESGLSLPFDLRATHHVSTVSDSLDDAIELLFTIADHTHEEWITYN